ncbi:ubiquinone biosynthesis protein COQ4 [Trichocoleus desertorum AS-A10]|uniref:Coq4 family protein n=1 Tax=Trichocoleus desertorum TaxID=1481672 RepID=UPI00329A5AF3
MNAQTVATPASNPRVERFFKLIDRIAELRGRNVPTIVNLTTLRSLPTGTFGRAWADFLAQHGLSPLTTGSRRKQLHDGIHILTGYGSDSIGEAEVQAFLLGTKFSTTNLLIGLGLLRLLYQQLPQNQTPKFSQMPWERLKQAYQRGQRSRLEPDTWQPEQLWQLPLAQVQALFGLEAQPSPN